MVRLEIIRKRTRDLQWCIEIVYFRDSVSLRMKIRLVPLEGGAPVEVEIGCAGLHLGIRYMLVTCSVFFYNNDISFVSYLFPREDRLAPPPSCDFCPIFCEKYFLKVLIRFR